MQPSDLVLRHLRHLEMQGYADKTIYGRHRALIRMAAALNGPLAGASEDDLMAWRMRLQVSPGAVLAYVAHAREFYAWLVAEGVREDNPAARLPVPKIARGHARPISEEDLTTALACARPRIRPWLVLAGWCGLRAKEIALLRRENVLDTRQPPVIVVASDATKGIHERIVPMPRFVLSEVVPGLPGSGYCYRRGDGLRGPNAPHRVSTLCNQHLRECGIQATLHQLRHRCFTLLYDDTLDVRLVQEAAGHRSPETTVIYTKLSQSRSSAAFERLPVPRRLQPVVSLDHKRRKAQ